MLLSATNQITRYKIEINDKVQFTNDIKSKLEQFSAFDVDNTPDEKMIGFADHQDNFATNFDKIYVGDYIVFTMRIDEKKVNKHILEKQLSRNALRGDFYVKKKKEKIRH